MPPTCAQIVHSMKVPLSRHIEKAEATIFVKELQMLRNKLRASV